MEPYKTSIKGLDHAAYRCRDTEETRVFYEDILGLRLSAAIDMSETKTGRPLRVMHSFFEMNDNSYIAFFEVPEGQSEEMFQCKSDFDLHLAVGVDDMSTLLSHKDNLIKHGYEVRGPSDHGFCQSIYCYDPNGYVVELAARTEKFDAIMSAQLANAHQVLENWQATKHNTPRI